MNILTDSKKLTYILIGLIAIVVFFAIVLVVSDIGGSAKPVTLQFWGVFDSKTAYEKVISDFQKAYPNITVVYTQKSPESYEGEAINAFASGTGPDVWMINNTWVVKHQNKLRPMPTNIPDVKNPLMTTKDFRDTFVDVAYNDLVVGDKIYSMPLYVDTLAMFYNKGLLNSAGIVRPPADWKQFNEDVATLTQLDPNGNIIQSGAAMGTARNINSAADILMALMIQSGVQMVSIKDNEATFSKSVGGQAVGRIALEYYTDFANPQKETYSWNPNQAFSIDNFTNGNVAIMINYAHQIKTLQDKAARLDFGIAPMPQLDVADARNYASYWSPAVPMISKHPNEAWIFINYLASHDPVLSYLSRTQRPSARKDIIQTLLNDPLLGVFAKQALSAKSWYQVDNTSIEKIFSEMIDDINFRRKTYADAIANAESRVTLLMRQHKAAQQQQ